MDKKLFWETGGFISLALVGTFLILIVLGTIPANKIFLDSVVILGFIIVILISARFFVNLFSGTKKSRK